MAMRQLVFFAAGWFCCAVGADDTLRHTYRQITGTDTTGYSWMRYFSGDTTVIFIDRGNVQYTNWCDSSGATRAWRMEKKDTTAHVRRHGKKLTLTACLGTDSITRDMKISSLPWYQPFSFSIGRFVCSGRKRETFWFLRDDKLKPIKMCVERNGETRLDLHGTTEEACKATVTLTGLLKCMWKGEYWHRLSDGLFLRYRGATGPPGSPVAAVELERPPFPAVP